MPAHPVLRPARAVIAGRGLTLTDVALEVGVNAATLGRVLNGHITPWPALKARLAKLLDTPVETLFPDDVADVELVLRDRAAR
jgi:transcriptional regulator with XRE-family HTH domain